MDTCQDTCQDACWGLLCQSPTPGAFFFFFFADVLPVTKPRRDVRGSCSQAIISLILLRLGKVSVVCYGCLLLSISEDVLMGFH